MGMFDSLYDERGWEWQTKAFNCNLDAYMIGDEISADMDATFQVEVLGGPTPRDTTESLATVRNGVLWRVPDERDERLLLLNYSGHVIAHPRSATKGI